MKYLLFIRHVETTKNLKKEFSKDHKTDELTIAGKMQANNLVSFLKKSLATHKLKMQFIYTSECFRAIDTGIIISRELNIPLLQIKGLSSFNLGELGGLSEKETQIKFPLFYKQLTLYRNGLLNSYEINYPADAERPFAFETRVQTGIKRLLEDQTEDLKIVILHRSVLTATYIYFARAYHNYPKNFYGFVPINNGSITLLEYVNNTWEFRFVNENPTTLPLLA